MSAEFDHKIQTAVADPRLQLAIYSATGRLMDHRRKAVDPDVLSGYQSLRDRAHALKKHTIENLDYYLELLERRVEDHGGKVVFCKDATDVADFILNLAKERRARLIVKSKSMTSEEVDLNERLEEHDLTAVETDLGEFIIQLAHERPYHIVAPALHKTRFDVADLFEEKLGVPRETEIEKQTMIARAVLRDRFLHADIGISGANFLVADAGAVVLVENEGNARLTTSTPKIHIAVAGIEKLIPRMQDLAVFLKLLGRSATGQALTAYTSILSGPKRETEVDGPDEFYIVLLDNGRTRLLADKDKRESLYCIRCGACLNHCPVYRKIGGHSFPWVYSGPIGAILTPQFMGPLHEPALPFASSLCGACAEVCPVKIDIPRILLDLRSEVKKAESRDKVNRWEKMAFGLWAWVMQRPRLYEMMAMAAASLAPQQSGYIKSVPGMFNVGPVRAWASQRDLPAPAPLSFRQLWRARRAKQESESI